MESNFDIELFKDQLIRGLKTFLKLGKEWDELVLVKSLNLIIQIIELEGEIQATIQNSKILQNSFLNQPEVEHGYAWKQFLKLNDYHLKLEAVLVEMINCVSKVDQSCDYFEQLVQKACQTHGTKIVFQTPIGLTWSIPQLGDKIITFSSQYSHSVQFHHSLYFTIISQSSTTAEKQAALSYWACQPLLDDQKQLKDLLSIEFPLLFKEFNLTPSKSNKNKYS